MTHLQESFDLGEPSGQEMERLMTEKAHELFRVCDTEQKGFITKRDMQRLQNELPLSPDQLEHVFDSLDDDGNGFLTLEEFTDGFGSFLGLKVTSSRDEAEAEQNDMYADEQVGRQEEESQTFKQMMDNLGASSLYEDEAAIQSMWSRLRQDAPDMASNFEDFIYKVSHEIKRSKTDFDTLEGALKSKSMAHDEEVRKLYEEMEFQIRSEKEKILSEEKAKERQLREAMEHDLNEKDRQLQDLLGKHTEMEDRLGHLNTIETETKLENEKLAKEKEELEEALLRSRSGLEESKSYIGQLREQQKNEKRERARAALKLSEGIAIERESLVKQLETLKSMNKKLLDDKDEAEIRRDTHIDHRPASMQDELDEVRPREAAPVQASNGDRRGSVLGKYFHSKGIPKLSAAATSISEDVEDDTRNVDIASHLDVGRNVPGNVEIDDDIECDDDVYVDGHEPSFIHHNISSITHSSMQDSPRIMYRGDTNDGGDGDIEAMEADLRVNDEAEKASAGGRGDTMARGGRGIYRQGQLVSLESGAQIGSENTTSRSGDLAQTGNVNNMYRCPNDGENDGRTTPLPESQRGQPVGADGRMENGIQSQVGDSAPASVKQPARQRVFKVVFVGDSGVGKSTFLHRFCSNVFRPTFAATVGVDFQIKSLIIEDTNIVLQLWDTAGQERFRSITKQYFRKADGVIVMYDVTSEATFINVRSWMNSVQEGASEDAVIVLLGNKNDLPEEDDVKAVKMKDASKLADEYSALFYETSALSGENVTHSMEALARILKEKEDREIEKSFHLEEGEAKKGCCKS